MRSWNPVVGALTCACALLLPGQALATDHVTRPCAGVVVTERQASPRAARLLVAQVRLSTAGLAVRVTPPSGTREVARETTLGFLTRTGACVAVNGHFFLPFPSDDADA